MKYLIVLFACLLVGFVAKSQSNPSGFPTQKNIGWAEWGWLMSDSGHIIATRIPNFTPRYAGTIILNQQSSDSSFKYWTGGRWLRLLSSKDSAGFSSNNIANALLRANGDYLQKWQSHILSIDSIDGELLLRAKTIGNGGNRNKDFRLLWDGPNTGNSPDAFELISSLKSSDGISDSIWRGILAETSGLMRFVQRNEGRYSAGVSINNGLFSSISASSLMTGLGSTVSMDTGRIIIQQDHDSIVIKGARAAATADTLLALGPVIGGYKTLLKIPNTSTGSGTVTSVGLSMPAAFTVTNSPVTTNGTISVSGAGTGLQYIKGNGTLGTTDTSMIPNFYAKVRSEFSGTSPITYNSTTGAIGINDANTSGTKGAATFSSGSFSDNGSGTISLVDVITGSSCLNCQLTYDSKGRITSASNGVVTPPPVNALGAGDTLVIADDTIKRLNPGYGILHTVTQHSITTSVDTSKIATQYDLTQVVKTRYSIIKGTGDSVQLLNDVRNLNRNYSYGTMNDSIRIWHPSYWSYIDKYFADTATSAQTNVGGSSTVQLSNGSWLTAYTGFGTNPEDAGSSTIYAINSNDNLRTFYNKRQIVALDTVEADFGPSLYVKGTNLSTGDTIILIWATQISHVTNNYVGDIRIRQSNDGGATWGAISILQSAASNYYNNYPNRIIRTNTGKLIYPFELLTPGSSGPGGTGVGWRPRFLYSTNNGTTWTYSTAIPIAPDSGTIESGCYQRRNETRLYWYARSRRENYVYTSYSDDDGVTWATPDYMNYSSPDANTTIKYLNSSDCFIGFSNRVNGATQPDRRKYLSAFMSYDGVSFNRAFNLDSVVDGAPGAIAVSDIIDLDSAVVVFYSFLPNPSGPTNLWGSMKVARIPKTMINFSFENTGSGLSVPSGGDADRIASYLPNFRWNTTGYYEGSFGAMFGYGSFLATGDLLDPIYPFKTMKLQSHSQIGRLTLYNKDNATGWYGDFQFEKSYNNNYNMGADQIVGNLGGNTMSYMRFITNATQTGGFSNVDIAFGGYNAAGVSKENARFTAEGVLKINTNVNSTNIDGRKLYVNGSIGANKDSIDLQSTIATRQILVIDTTSGKFQRMDASSLGGTTIYTGDGTLAGNRTVSGAGNNLTYSNLGQYLFQANSVIQEKAGGTVPYSSLIGAGAANEWQFAYTPTPANFSKGTALRIDTINNTYSGSTANTSYSLKQVGGALFVGDGLVNRASLYQGYLIVSTNTTLDSTSISNIYVDATSTNITVTLPTVAGTSNSTLSGQGVVFFIKRIDSSGNTVTVQTQGSDLIDGSSSFTLTSNSFKTVQSIGSNRWVIIN